MQLPATPVAARVVPVMSGLRGRTWLGGHANPCAGTTSGKPETYGFTAKRSTRPFGRPST